MSLSYNKLAQMIFVLIVGSMHSLYADELSTPTAGGDQLMEAIEKNDGAKVDELLAKKINPNARGNKNKYLSPLNLAAKNNNMHILESLVRSGANIKGESVVCVAINNVQMVNWLIEQGAEFRGAHCEAIRAAISAGALDTADLLIKRGADINAQTTMFKRTQLQDDAQHGREPSVRWLVDHGADVNIRDAQDQTAFTLGASYGANAAILKILLDHGAIVSSGEMPGMIQGACRAGNLDALNFLEQKGLTKDFSVCYAALSSVTHPDPAILNWVAKRVPIKNNQIGKESMLHVAAESNNMEIARRLLTAGADVNAPGLWGRPPLDATVFDQVGHIRPASYKEIRDLLLKHGADINIRYEAGKETLLHKLADAPNIAPSPQNYWEDYCQKSAEMADQLISSGADINARDSSGNTPLHYAAITSNYPMMQMLVARGADLKISNNEGHTPLMASISKGHWGFINRELTTLGMLVSLERKAGTVPDWPKLRAAANKVHNERERTEILSMVDQIEKAPVGLSQGTGLENVVTKIVESAPKTRQERLNSCDSNVAVAAAEEIINDPNSLNEPLELFRPSFVLFTRGKKDEAVFWFYAAQLRARYQVTINNGDRSQLVTVMLMTIGPAINNYAFKNVPNFIQVLDSVLDWDKRTHNPFIEKIRLEGKEAQVEQIRAGLQELKEKISAEKDDVERKAHLAAADIEKSYLNLDRRCVR
jgi:ankyrin repeat protein